MKEKELADIDRILKIVRKWDTEEIIVDQPKSKRTGGELNQPSLKPMAASALVVEKQSRASSPLTISSMTEPIIEKKADEDGGYMNGLQSKDTPKTDTDSSVTTVTVRVGSTESVRISCPANNAAFIVRAVNTHEELLGHLKVFKNYVGELLASGRGNGSESKIYPLIEQAIAKAEARS